MSHKLPPFFVFRTIILVALYSTPSSSQTIQQIIWNVPDGKLSDLSQTFTSGQTLPLSWNSYDSTQYVDTTKNLVDLWISAFDFNLNPFSAHVTTRINLTSPGNFAWTIAIPDSNLTVSAKYVLRFKITGTPFETNNGELSSPGFLVLKSASASTTTSKTSTSSSSSSSSSFVGSSSSTTSDIATAISTTSATQASSTSSSTGITADTTKSPLSTGAIAGVVIGAVAVIAIMGVCVYICLARRRKREAAKRLSEAGHRTMREEYKVEADGEGIRHSEVLELPGTGRVPVEIHGRGSGFVAELPTYR